MNIFQSDRIFPQMVAYEFYLHDERKGDQLIGILPERRKKSERITDASIMKWANVVFGETLDLRKIFFVEISLEKGANGCYFPKPLLT